MVMGEKEWHKYQKRKSITYSQYKSFLKQMTRASLVSVSANGRSYVIKGNGRETNPNVTLIGSDEYFFSLMNLPIEVGRGFTNDDIFYGRNIAVIGNDVTLKLFPNINPIGKKIKIQNQEYMVAGCIGAKGAVMGQSRDNQVIVPITQYLRYFSNEWEESLTLSVQARSKEEINDAVDEATGIMRSVRNVKPWEDNSFEIETNETVTEQFSSFTDYLSYFGAFCGFIALIAAGVGIMNIMLISVKERTREIGVRKAMGARRSWIMTQFIVETITLCQIGGIIGIALGVAAGGLFSMAIGIKLTMPINWIIASIVICTILGIVSGAYPAWKAAKLDPIEALRYE
jgi:putative ABC transport system permease protein